MELRVPDAVIRRIAVEDVDDVVAACAWLFAPPASVPDLWDPAAARERLFRLCDASRSTDFVADLDGIVIGFCTVYLDLDSLRFGQRAWLNELAVHPAHRSRRVGHRLLHAAQRWARDHGATPASARLQHGPDRRASLLPPRETDVRSDVLRLATLTG